MKELEKLVRLQSFLKSYIQTKKQNEQISVKLVGSHNKKASSNLHYNSIKIEEYRNEIHSLCVELGLADYRGDEYYQDYTAFFGSIEILIKKRKPII